MTKLNQEYDISSKKVQGMRSEVAETRSKQSAIKSGSKVLVIKHLFSLLLLWFCCNCLVHVLIKGNGMISMRNYHLGLVL